MKNARFEWDDDKAETNRHKHRVGFDEACEVFGDPHALDEIDDSVEEERWRRIGRARSGLLFVVYVERTTRIRIITARRANKRETAAYRGQAPSEE